MNNHLLGNILHKEYTKKNVIVNICISNEFYFI